MLIIDFFPRIWMTHSFSWGGAAKEGGGLNKEGKGLIEEVDSSAHQRLTRVWSETFGKVRALPSTPQDGLKSFGWCEWHRNSIWVSGTNTVGWYVDEPTWCQWMVSLCFNCYSLPHEGKLPGFPDFFLLGSANQFWKDFVIMQAQTLVPRSWKRPKPLTCVKPSSKRNLVTPCLRNFVDIKTIDEPKFRRFFVWNESWQFVRLISRISAKFASSFAQYCTWNIRKL